MILCQIHYLTGTGLESAWRSQLIRALAVAFSQELPPLIGHKFKANVIVSEIDPRSICEHDLLAEVKLSTAAQVYSQSVYDKVVELAKKVAADYPKSCLRPMLLCFSGREPTVVQLK